MREGCEFRRSCSRRWRGRSRPLTKRRLHVREIAKNSLFAKWIAVWRAVLVGSGGGGSACGARGERRSASHSPAGAAGTGQADLYGAGLAAVYVSDGGRVVARRVDRHRQWQRWGRWEHQPRRRKHRRRRRRLQHDDGAELGLNAASAAGAMGISATALAATCAMESNCQNVGSSGGSSATGAFQMIASTYNADIKGSEAHDPSIAGTIVSGSAGEMDPVTEAYAAAYELRQDAVNLQNGGFRSAIQRSLMCGRYRSGAARVQVSPPRLMTPILPNSRG